MYTQFFGSYLYEQGLVSIDELVEGLQIQSQVRLKLGVLAISAGYMNAMQVEEVHNRQANVDKRIGEIAVDLGFLTETQVDELLGSQKSGYLLLGQALVDKGYLSNENFEKAINGYKKKYGVTADQMNNPSEDDEVDIIDLYFNFNNDIDKEYKNFILIMLRSLIRFIGSDFAPLNLSAIEQFHGNNTSYQVVEGNENLFTAIDAEDKAFVGFASRFAEEELDEVDELAKDSVSEFLNLSNGLYTVNRSNVGIELQMLPQCTEKNKVIKDINKGYLIKVAFGFGVVSLIITK